MSKTQENLKAAFAGESQANRKYLVFSKKAEDEGKPNLAKFFRAAAEGETVHALNHLDVLGGVESSADNIKDAIAGEIYEIETMYPQFIGDAEAENETQAKISMSNAAKVEAVHQKMLQEALKNIETGSDIDDSEYYVCGVCGFPAVGEAPERCPICGSPREKFSKI